MTALKTRSAPQFEVLLKLKQSHNEDFAFLHENNELNLYYCWLRDGGCDMRKNLSLSSDDSSKNASLVNNPSKNNTVCSTDSRDSTKDVNSMDAILGMYSSSESDEDENNCAPMSSVIEQKNKLNSHEIDLTKVSKCKEYSSTDLECSKTIANVLITNDESNGGQIKKTSTLSSHDVLNTIDEQVHRNEGAIGQIPQLLIASCNSALTMNDQKRNEQRNKHDNTVKDSGSQMHCVLTSSSNTTLSKKDEQEESGQETAPEPNSTISAEQKARRLKRAKILKGHFALKMIGSK